MTGPLKVHPLRDEDIRLIDQWIRARSGQDPEPIAHQLYKSDNMPPLKYWSPVHCTNCRIWMTAFARRCRVPLQRVGLDALGQFTEASVRTEIEAYAADYAARNKRRLEDLAKTIGPDEQRAYGPIVWRTRGWNVFIKAGVEFYAWQERMGLRPKNSNPFRNIHVVPELKAKEILIVNKWFERIFDYPKTIKNDAIVSLLFSGLRCREIAEARAVDFVHRPERGNASYIRIVGKGNKPRTVWLLYRQAWSLNRWIQHRRMTESPWLFPSTHRLGQPITIDAIGRIVERICLNIFSGREETWIRKKITPHKFRHFYATNALAGGMKPHILKLQLGHSDTKMQERYTKFDPKLVEQEIIAFDHGDTLVVPTDGSAPRVLRKRSRIYDAGYDPADRHGVPTKRTTRGGDRAANA